MCLLGKQNRFIENGIRFRHFYFAYRNARDHANGSSGHSTIPKQFRYIFLAQPRPVFRFLRVQVGTLRTNDIYSNPLENICILLPGRNYEHWTNYNLKKKKNLCRLLLEPVKPTFNGEIISFVNLFPSKSCRSCSRAHTNSSMMWRNSHTSIEPNALERSCAVGSRNRTVEEAKDLQKWMETRRCIARIELMSIELYWLSMGHSALNTVLATSEWRLKCHYIPFVFVFPTMSTPADALHTLLLHTYEFINRFYGSLRVENFAGAPRTALRA